jgi:WhiB family transcriptional regulator, redox-sensing transcriptional regulator
VTQPINDWSAQGACKNKKAALFCAEVGELAKRAKAICSQCPVKVDCLEYALVHREKGIWGGTNTRERREQYPEFLVTFVRTQYEAKGLVESRSIPELYSLTIPGRRREQQEELWDPMASIAHLLAL